ncbi:lactate dehydrogenase-like 2-hydroxyacid dehydrogenase [Promicromonospora sp. AC04]|uniref:D-2-hydroxyacid dehydrogenase family protein n=1 Tax=Promicromonospora sp. AC04 TaxID=2135723 RepID=UPI000D3CD4E1|nr:D-2-hydroxyacid dehydrogenase family protein [Promicromonospora sp. AC04]PUB26255.1 lactate dehydrogenase-like 2-hydroxyacid dehydrogenase [Promicromonospora sp. AC04]
MRIAVLDDYQQAAHRFADWDSLGADVAFHPEHIDDPAALAVALAGVDVVVAMRERTPFSAAVLDALPDLRLLVTTGRANASIDLDAARARDVVVCGTDSPSSATPELTWALILAVARHVPQEDARLRAGGWQHTIGTDLAGRTLGVVGLGRLGTQVARIGAAFGMDVVAWSAHLDPAVAAEAGVHAVAKEELFATADVVTVHYKLSPRSVGIVGRDDLARMKPTAFLINTSRGPLVDTGALLEALHAGRIGGAGLDVYDVEPLPADHPLRSAPRTVLTPHLGYVTQDTYATFFPQAVEDIAAWAAGSPVRVLG